MKKYIYIIIALVSFNVFAQTTPPTSLVPFLKSVFYHDPISNTDWVFRGAIYGWAKVSSPVLYTATGSNTDGAMTQQATTNALNTKLNTSLLTATSNFLTYIDGSGNFANSNIKQESGNLAINFPSNFVPSHQVNLNTVTLGNSSGFSSYLNYVGLGQYQRVVFGKFVGTTWYIETEHLNSSFLNLRFKTNTTELVMLPGNNDAGSISARANISAGKASQFVVSGLQDGTAETFGSMVRSTINKTDTGIFNGGGVSLFLQNYVTGNANRLFTLGTNSAPAGDITSTHTGYYDFFMDKFVSINPIYAPAGTLPGQVVNKSQLDLITPIKVTGTIDFEATPPNSSDFKPVAFAGAAVGDAFIVGATSLATTNYSILARCTTAGTVSLIFFNNDPTVTVNPSSTTITIKKLP